MVRMIKMPINQKNIDPVIAVEERRIREILDQVYDPEIPVLSITDLGIVREIWPQGKSGTGHNGPEIVITPTYSGCPAMDMIAVNIRMAMLEHGFQNIKITTVLSPAWTTDWMTEKGKQKLLEYGIAPPNPRQQVCNNELFAPHEAVQCPHCGSWHTKRLSEFGSTACKALYQCENCLEPFDYFKCH